jgi:hypothetical protein
MRIWIKDTGAGGERSSKALNQAREQATSSGPLGRPTMRKIVDHIWLSAKVASALQLDIELLHIEEPREMPSHNSIEQLQVTVFI